MVFFGLVQIISLFLAGFIVSYNFLVDKITELEKVRSLVEKSKLYVGLLSVFMGIWSLFNPYYRIVIDKNYFEMPFGSVSFIGDLIPSILLIICGVTLASVVLKYINLSDDSLKSDFRKTKTQELLDKYSFLLGIITFIFGFLHLVDVIGGGYPLI
ncbi:MAG: hypothetical protein OEV44_03105 [Spirochaetota bacterium]|nr:hypothetical protein [Spirochaetota bacterium]